MFLPAIKLFIAFFKVGLFGWAGGTALIPLIERECVINNHWMSSQDFAQLLAINAALPGVYAVKLAAYIGYKTGGLLGSVISVIGISIPGIILLFILFTLIVKYREARLLNKMILGVQYGAAGFLAYSVFKVLPMDYPSKTALFLGLFLATGVCISLRYGFNPILAVILSGLLGLVLF